MSLFNNQVLKQIRVPILLLLIVILLSACGGHVYHRVQRGETLYSIGWAYGYDYRQVAKWNGIKSPYQLSPGQRLRVAPPSGYSAAPLQEYQPENNHTKNAHVQRAAPVIGPTGDTNANDIDTSSRVKKDVRKVVSKVKEFFGSKTLNWRWPTKNRRILRTFSATDPTRQGLDIAGNLRDPIYSASAGKVVYAGSGLARYGKLIIVKHNEKYLSAYAHNNKLHVKEGEVVTAGQKIAEMGSDSVNGSKGRVKLHFEIRRNGKPVDPMGFLPGR